jgi:N utilization substance protein A
MSGAREPGNRAKIGVTSRDTDIDPVGACVGMKGSRVQSVVQELRGEKIDIIEWNADPAKFVCNALAPAIISKVIIDQVNKTMEVVVPDDQLSLAIGKRGQNVRLASRLTGWKIDVKGETVYRESREQEYQSLMEVLGDRKDLMEKLSALGVSTIQDLARMEENELVTSLEEVTEAEAEGMIQSARKAISEKQADEKQDGQAPEEQDQE